MRRRSSTLLVLAIVSWIVGVPLLVLGGLALLSFTVDMFDPDATGFEIIAGTVFVAGSWTVFTVGFGGCALGAWLWRERGRDMGTSLAHNAPPT
jgi:hypothetical protein